MARRISLRARIVAYLILLHLVMAAMAVPVLLDRPGLLLAFEAIFAVSAVVGWLLVRAFFVPLELIRTGAELMRERDFTTHFRQVGQPEMDALIQIYNQMADRLREERLQLEERNLFVDLVIQASPGGLLVLDHDGRVSEVNPSAARILELAPGEGTGLRPAELPHPLGAVLDELASQESRVVSIRGRRLRCRRAEFYDRGAQRTFFVVDEMTREVRAIERATYSKIIRMMSHEVRNSVGAVRSLLESCTPYGGQLAPPDREDFDRALEVASTRLQRLNSFMDGLASVVRIPVPERRACDVVALLRDLERLLRPELERRRIRFELAAGGPMPVSLDKNQFEQVLVNVLRNAMEAIGEDGVIRAAVGATAGRPWLSIRDSGPGLDDGLGSRVFTPFFSTKPDGQGVGLTLSREILGQHGFDFSLESHPEGGAEFKVWLG